MAGSDMEYFNNSHSNKPKPLPYVFDKPISACGTGYMEANWPGFGALLATFIDEQKRSLDETCRQLQ